MDDVPFLDVLAGYRELEREIDDAYRRVMGSGWYILGAEVEAFEADWTSHAGESHCAGVASGLDALILVLMAWGLGPGDEVIVPSNTYIATWLAVTRVGATPVPVEPAPGSYNIDPDGVASAVTPRTRVILPVHLYGHVAPMGPLRDVADAHGLKVLADAAQAHGARYRGAPVATLADATAWSFYPTKNLGAFGDAGAVTTADAGLADRLRVLRNYGSRTRYHHDELGLNSRLDPLQAAFLRVKLGVLDAWNARRAEVARKYIAELGDLPWLGLPEPAPWEEPVWHLFVVRTAHRDALARHLAARGVQTLVHYPTPPHRAPAYAGLGLAQGAFPTAEALSREVLSLPVGPHMTPAEQERVVEAVRSFRPKARGGS